MTRLDAVRLATCAASIAAAVLASAERVDTRQLGTAQFSVPAAVSFQVQSISASTSGGVTRVSFQDALILPLQAIRISVRADANLTGPPGFTIAASSVSWSTSGVSNGTAANGALSTSAYTQVFQGNTGSTSGGVDLTWSLAAPGIPFRAGTYQATARWRIEAVSP